jgi:hypothetical protein
MIIAAGCSSDATKSTGASTIAVASTVAATTTATEVPTTPAPTVAPTTTIPGEGPQVAADTGPSAWIEGAQAGDPEATTDVGVCEPLYDAIAGGPYSVQRCGVWNAVGGQRMWTVTKGSSGLFFAIIWQQSAPTTWVPVMRAMEAVPGVWEDFTIATANIDAGPNDELVSGIRVAGSGGYLSINVVDIRSDNPRSVAVYNEIAQGIAALSPGNGVLLWQALYGTTDPECCPSTYLRHHLTATGGDWFVSDGPIVSTGYPSIPASEF